MTGTRQDRSQLHSTGRYTVRLVLCFVFILMLITQMADASVVLADLRITHIQQQEGTFKLYLNLLEQNGQPISLSQNPEDYSIYVDAVAPFAPESVTSISQSGEGVAYIVVVDVSGSITEQETSAIKQALNDFVMQMGDIDMMRLMTVGTDVIVAADYTNDKNVLKSAIENSIHRRDQKTELYQGLCQALDSTNTRTVDGPSHMALIVFTDGGDDSKGVWTVESVTSRLESVQYPVYAVTVKGNANTSPASINQLCEQTGGYMYHTDKADQISIALSKIRIAVNSTQILVAKPTDPNCFGVRNLGWQVQLRSGNQDISSRKLHLSTFPTPPPVIEDLTFSDEGIASAIRTALGKEVSAPLLENDLDAIAQITTLVADSSNVSSLEDLALMPNLTTLSLRENGLVDLAGLKDITSLTSLDLKGNRITDASPLKYLENLQSLNLSDNNLEDVTFLRGLTKLTQLDLSSNCIEDIHVISELNHLTDLNLANNFIADPSPLAKLQPTLQVLNLSSNSIESMESLLPMQLAGCQITPEVPVSEIVPEPEANPVLLCLMDRWPYLAVGLLVVLGVIIFLFVWKSRKKNENDTEEKTYVDSGDDFDPDGTLGSTLGAPLGDLDETIALNPSLRIQFTINMGGKIQTITKSLEEHHTLVVGRSEECDVVISNQHVSRNHAAIALDFANLIIKDLGSKAGTILNGHPIGGNGTSLKQNASIKIGPAMIKIRILQ